MTKVKHLAVIPARGGSVSIPDKNIRKFAGKPLIAWTIERALASEKLDRVIVSTDSDRIADVARRYGAWVPFLRPSSIAASDTAIEPVLTHAYEWMRNEAGYDADSLVLLFPTNPLRETRHIDDAISQFEVSGADAVVTVHESPAHYTPYWTLVKDQNSNVCYFGGTDVREGYTRRQDFPDVCYAKNDLVFVIRPQNLFAAKPSLYGEKVELSLIDRAYDGDINDPQDWALTELMFHHLSQN